MQLRQLITDSFYFIQKMRIDQISLLRVFSGFGGEPRVSLRAFSEEEKMSANGLLLLPGSTSE